MKKSLPQEQRRFLQRVADTAFVNPFSERFEVLEDRLLTDAAGDATEEQRLTILIDVLAQNFEPLLQQGSLNIADYRGSEQKILLISLLYYLYRHYQQRFDQYIQ